ncbi:MAG TPA: response regulator transcription factor [Erysipelothrix sp.]|nr:response regulator transcription factor [Erysipelothrix sp.]
MVKILVIEDEESIRRLIRYDLRVSGYEVDSEEDGLKGLDKALNIKYDVIVIDWMLPGLDGLSIVKELRNNRVDSIIIMLTAKDQETDILESFEAGVDDYITKPFSPRQLQARIKAHLKRVIVTTTVEETIGNLSLNRNLHEVKVKDEVVNLTKKEYDLLLYLVDNKNHVLSREQILSEIWNFDYDGDTRIVDVHIFKLRSKLEQATLIIEAMRGVGYVLKV